MSSGTAQHNNESGVFALGLERPAPACVVIGEAVSGQEASTHYPQPGFCYGTRSERRYSFPGVPEPCKSNPEFRHQRQRQRHRYPFRHEQQGNRHLQCG